ncbi:fimbrial biogenesis outer membrane usher protein [Shewanella algae]|uniref:fimbria/pilus outer membrane usher protein n=1 Tax=Shewanella algae TaxID=38313 RepID=UPI001AAC9316|nr:fimbria/pilus outer membrane usher protein [Shewanella algae]MBO2675581.1 fimbrial biogenesis outer membrane usher protein [Shewanella algae]
MTKSLAVRNLILLLFKSAFRNVSVRGLFLVGFSFSVGADIYFNPDALELSDSGQEVDLVRFLSQGEQLPGTYLVDLYLNQQKIDHRYVNFKRINGQLLPEFTPEQLKEIGVKVDAFPQLVAVAKNTKLTNLGDYIPNAATELDFGRQQLNISIPQAALLTEARDYVDPAEWDDGLPMAFVNYSFHGGNIDYDYGRGASNTHFLGLQTGINWGAWRFRNYSTYSKSSDTDGQWSSISSYLERDIHSIRGRLTMGDSYTPATLFESLPFRGVQLSSDDNMLPDSLKGFAPIVRGIARSNAQITVRQNGYIIYQTYVAPGNFEITDLYQASSSGELELMIKEADGTERRSIVPYSSVPVMVRKDSWRYAITGGQYHPSDSSNALKPYFGQGSLVYGLLDDTTVYGGFQLADDYQALALGFGYSLGSWGSISLDATHAESRLRDDTRSRGQSYRFQYSKDITMSGTSLTLAGYRYSTSGFYDFAEVNELVDKSDTYTKRERLQLYVNQSLDDWGNLYLSAYQQNYWRSKGYNRSLTAGYNFSVSGVNYNLSYTESQQPFSDDNDRQFAFNVQIPLDLWGHNSWASYSFNNSSAGDTSHTVGLSGTALENDNLSYNIQQSYANHGQGGSGSLSGNYRNRYGNLNAGYSYNNRSRQVNYGVEGGVVAHPYGVTLSQPLGETMALVKAAGAEDVRVQSGTGILTDGRGYAVVPYVSPYRKNRIALDTQTMASNVDMNINTKMVIPTKGALVLADFKVNVGSRLLLTLAYQGQPVPFGAQAKLRAQETDLEAIVGMNGQVYLSGMPESGQLEVSWGTNQQCLAQFSLPKVRGDSVVQMLAAECRER